MILLLKRSIPLLLLFFLLGCEIEGRDFRDEDHVMLTPKDVTIGSLAQDIVATTEIEQWYVSAFVIDGKSYYASDKNSPVKKKDDYLYEYEWFKVSVDKNKRKITVSMTENRMKERNLLIILNTYWGSFHELAITQKGM